MSAWKGYDKIFIYVRGKRIINNKIAIDELGLILRRFQDLYYNIGKIVAPNLEKDELSLFFFELKEGGSVSIGIQHEDWEPTLIKEYEKPDRLLTQIFEAALESDYNKGMSMFKELISSPISRVEILSRLENFWSTRNRKISIGFGKSFDNVEYKKLLWRYKHRLYTWLKKEEEELSKEIKCFITRVKYDHPSSFTIKDENGNMVTGKLNKAILPDVKRYATELVKIKGVIIRKGKEYKFQSVDSIKLEPYIEFKDNIMDLKINQNLKFKAEWFEDGIILTEPDFKLQLYVKSLSEIEIELKEYLEILQEQYIEEDDKNLEEKARIFKNQLIKLLD